MSKGRVMALRLVVHGVSGALPGRLGTAVGTLRVFETCGRRKALTLARESCRRER